ncbi:MAG: uroporphyrinogen-III synthase [Alphaproteobacteria bacterium]|nr:uroporphyrinogen-III synthase [Alphaproteobacteria bacterium]
MTGPLTGKRIAVPESRELDLFARMLEEQGAETLRCPLVAIRDLDDPAPADAWLRRLIAGRFDDLILLTGEGLRRLMGIAQRAGIDADVVAALGKLRTITRGPKPVRALRELGLKAGLSAAEPTTAGVIATLTAENLKGRTVGVQLYPDNLNAALLDFLAQAGATADPVLPYRYASDIEAAQVVDLIAAMAAGTLDAIAFTSSPQLERLAAVARQRGLEPRLRDGLARTKIAAVGPVVSAAVEKIGGHVAIAPAGGAFHLKPLVNAIVAALGVESRTRV